MVHPAKAHNAVAGLVDMYNEGLTSLLQENAQLRVALKQKEEDLAKLNEKHGALVKRSFESVTVLNTRVAELDAQLCAAREGPLPTADDGRGVGDAEPAEGGGALPEVRREVADDVRDGECPQPHPTLRDSAPPPGPAEACGVGPEDFGGTDEGSHYDGSGR